MWLRAAIIAVAVYHVTTEYGKYSINFNISFYPKKEHEYGLYVYSSLCHTEGKQ